MDTTRTPYELVLHDRPLDTLFGPQTSVFVPSHVTTLGQLSDIAQAYETLKNNDGQYDKQSTYHHRENIGSRPYQQQQLQWRFFYMDPNKLDQELEKMMIQQQNNSTLTEKQHHSFLRTLESELIKVNSPPKKECNTSYGRTRKEKSFFFVFVCIYLKYKKKTKDLSVTGMFLLFWCSRYMIFTISN